MEFKKNEKKNTKTPLKDNIIYKNKEFKRNNKNVSIRKLFHQNSNQ